MKTTISKTLFLSLIMFLSFSIFTTETAAKRVPEYALSISKTIAGEKEINASQHALIDFEITFQNTGKNNAQDIWVTDSYDKERVMGITGLPEYCEDNGSKIMCDIEYLNSGEVVSFVYTMRLKRFAPVGKMKNYVTITEINGEKNFDDNRDFTIVNILRGTANLPNAANAIHLGITKDVRDENGIWQKADTSNTAATLSNKDVQEVEYRIILSNTGNTAGVNVVIGDYFRSETLNRTQVVKVDGATWSAAEQTFTVPKIEAGQSVVIDYIAVLKKTSNSVNFSAKNVASINSIQAKSGQSINTVRTHVTGVNKSNAAFVSNSQKIALNNTKMMSTNSPLESEVAGQSSPTNSINRTYQALRLPSTGATNSFLGITALLLGWAYRRQLA